MPPKRNAASTSPSPSTPKRQPAKTSTDSPLKHSTTPASVSPTANTSSTKPSSAASSQSHTTSSLKPSTSTSSTSKSGKLSSAGKNDAGAIVQRVRERYVNETPQRVKLVDAFMAFLVVLGGVQFAYAVVGGNYPFNAFLSGFSATVGQFVLTASLRIQTNPANKSDFPTHFSNERAFADFVFGSLILHFFCVNFIN